MTDTTCPPASSGPEFYGAFAAGALLTIAALTVTVLWLLLEFTGHTPLSLWRAWHTGQSPDAIVLDELDRIHRTPTGCRRSEVSR
jgi:hypothetical protein